MEEKKLYYCSIINYYIYIYNKFVNFYNNYLKNISLMIFN